MVNDNYPSGNIAGKLLYNSLYHDGAFDGYFRRQYALVGRIHSIIPKNSQKPFAMLVNSDDKCVGYLVDQIKGETLGAYLEAGVIRDAIEVSARTLQVSKIEDLLSESDLYSVLARKKPSYLARVSEKLKEYSAASKMYGERADMLALVGDKLDEIADSLKSKDIYHNNISKENIVINVDDSVIPTVYLVNPMNSEDAGYAGVARTDNKDASDIAAVRALLEKKIKRERALAKKYSNRFDRLI